MDDSLGFQRGNLGKLRWFVPSGPLFGLEAGPITTKVGEKLGQEIIDFLNEKSFYLIAIGALVSYAGHASDSPFRYTLMMGGGALALLGIAPHVYGVVRDL